MLQSFPRRFRLSSSRNPRSCPKHRTRTWIKRPAGRSRANGSATYPAISQAGKPRLPTYPPDAERCSAVVFPCWVRLEYLGSAEPARRGAAAYRWSPAYDEID